MPTPQPPPPKSSGENGKHVVLVQVLTGQSTVDPKGYAHFKLSCPAPAVQTCQGTILLQVRIQPKKPKGSKKKPPLQTVTVGSGTFKIRVTQSAMVKVTDHEAGAQPARGLPAHQGEGDGLGEGRAERQGHHGLVRHGPGAGTGDHDQDEVTTSRRARSASSSPIASDAVAAGDGALRTCIIRSVPTIRKSSTRLPSGASA